VGHLRKAGSRAVLVKRGGARLLLYTGLLAIALTLAAPVWSWAFVLVPLLYLGWSLLKLAGWDRRTYPEFCADLFAFGHLAESEIQAAYERCRERLGYQSWWPGPRGTYSPGVAVYLRSVTAKWASVARSTALCWVRFRCGTDPWRWRRYAERPPFQFKLFTLAFCSWCAFAGFWANVVCAPVLVAGSIAMVYQLRNQRTMARVVKLDMEFMQHALPPGVFDLLVTIAHWFDPSSRLTSGEANAPSR
jgi:hypothetical protein